MTISPSSKLTVKDLGVLMKVAIGADANGTFSFSVRGLARDLEISVGELRWALQKLNKLGLTTQSQHSHNTVAKVTTVLNINELCGLSKCLTTQLQHSYNTNKVSNTQDGSSSGDLQESKKEEKVTKENKEYKENKESNDSAITSICIPSSPGTTGACTSAREDGSWGEREKGLDDIGYFNPSSVFAPPRTTGEVIEAATLMGVAISVEEAQRFIDYYTGIGWRTSGGAPIRKWQAFIRNWHSRWEDQKRREDGNRPVQRTGTTSRYFSGKYDEDEDESWVFTE